MFSVEKVPFQISSNVIALSCAKEKKETTENKTKNLRSIGIFYKMLPILLKIIQNSPILSRLIFNLTIRFSYNV
jgi:hypothetical protein